MTPYHNKYWAKLLTLKNPSSSIGSLTRSIANAKVDLNPHQIYAALFALKSPLSKGVILADEVGLGKTIEAGLVISQKWAEKKRKILLIVPAFLRQQWKQELLEKFFIPAKVIDGKKFKEFSDIGIKNPFDLENEVVICSYNFASNKSDFIRLVQWDLVIFDEAHRLRNIYKNSNKIAKNLSKALRPYFKVLLTATPLQNNLMELYGLVSVIDEHVFASESSFKDNFRETGEDQFWLLKKRLNLLCNRTLRKQVKEYIPFTKRISITWDFTPYEGEQKLYEAVSDYLRKDNAFGFTSGQKNLMILVFQKLLASSTFAISNTLNKMVLKLEQMTDSNDLLDDDYDAFESVEEEWKSDDDQVKQLSLDIESELQELRGFADLANQIKLNAKGDELIKALNHAFEKAEMLGALKKAVIFTESKVTQKYLDGKGNFIERQIHYIFGEQRVRNNREFFQVDPNRVKAAIDLIAIREVTPQIQNILETSDSEALSKNERKRPFRFSLAKIPIGATLTFSRDENITCQVIDNKNILFEGQKTSLSAVASKILNEKMGWTASQVQGPLFWMYEDETLVERRDRIENEEI